MFLDILGFVVIINKFKDQKLKCKIEESRLIGMLILKKVILVRGSWVVGGAGCEIG